MTTIVTRLYEDASHADAVVAALTAQGFPESCMDVVEQSGTSSAEETIEAAGVPGTTAQLYAQHLSSRRALLVVRAPFAPFGAAARAIEEADKYPAFDAGVPNENNNVPNEPKAEYFLSVLPSHRLFLTNHLDVSNSLKPRGISNAFRIPLLAEKPKQRMRPAILDQRFGNFLAPLITRRGILSQKPLINKFFGTFIVQHLTNWSFLRPSKMKHFRITN